MKEKIRKQREQEQKERETRKAEKEARDWETIFAVDQLVDDDDEERSIESDKRIIAKIRVGSIVLDALVDSGARSSFIRERWWRDIPFELLSEEEVELILGDASRRIIQTKRVRLREFTVDGVRLEQADFFLVDSLPYDCIIGRNLLAKMGATLDFTTGTMKQTKLIAALELARMEDEMRKWKEDLVSELDKGQEIEIGELKDKFRDLFKPVGVFKDIPEELEFKVELSKPVESLEVPQYRLNPIKREIIEKEFEKMKTILEKKSTNFVAPLVLAKKPHNRGWRLCIDFRKLNQVTKSTPNNLPKIDVLLQQLAGKSIYSALDFSSGYWQLPVEESSRKFLGVRGPDGEIYTCKRMPFGLKNAPSAFQKLMNWMFRKEIADGIVLVYLDDIVVMSNNFEEHRKHLRRVFAILQQHGAALREDKCVFGARTIKYLGFIVSSDGVRADAEKVETLRRWPMPRTKREIQSLLGVCNLYRRFIKDFG